MLSVIHPSQFGGNFARPTSFHPEFSSSSSGFNGYGSNFSANFNCGTIGDGFSHTKRRKYSVSGTNGSGLVPATTSGSGTARSIPSCFMPNTSELYYMSVASSSVNHSSSQSSSAIARSRSASLANQGSSGNNTYTTPASSTTSSMLFPKSAWSNPIFHPGYRSLPRSSQAVSSSSGAVSSTGSSRSMMSTGASVAGPNPWILSTSTFPNNFQQQPCCAHSICGQPVSRTSGSRKSSFAEQYSQACRVQEMEQRKRLSQQQQATVSLPTPPPSRNSRVINPNETKDYSKPLFVDCSIEYELPNAPKIPKNSEPILMIHPAYVNNVEQQQKELPRKVLTPKRSSDASKKIVNNNTYDYDYIKRNENCSRTGNMELPVQQVQMSKSEIELRRLKKEHEQQISMYHQQQQHFMQQHLRQQAMQARQHQLNMEMKIKSEGSPPRKMATSKMVTCTSLQCQCPEAVTYRRRLLQQNHQINQLKHHHAGGYLNNNTLIKPPPMDQPVRNMKRSYTDALLMDPSFLYPKVPSQYQQQMYHSAAKQARFQAY